MRKAIGSFKLLILVTALACYSVLLPAQTFNVIYNFTGGQDGGGPETGLTLVGTGTLYGTTWHGGGMNQGGTAYRLKHVGSGWVLQPLYAFAGDSDGCNSDSMLGFGPDGSLYGTTVYGGIVGCSGNSYGTVFNIRPQPTPPPSPLTPWHETVIHTFNGSVDGAYPHDLTFDAAGNIYGTTQQGALGSGTVYRLRKVSGSWVEDILYRFTGASDGGQPKAGVIRDSNGNLYGTTPFGGGIGYGTRCFNSQNQEAIGRSARFTTSVMTRMAAWHSADLSRISQGIFTARLLLGALVEGARSSSYSAQARVGPLAFCIASAE